MYMAGKNNKKRVPKKAPKAKKPVSRKKKTRKKDEISDKALKDLVDLALQQHATTSSHRRKYEIEAFNSVIEEFLQSFIILGYNLDDEPIVLINSKSQKDSDSLSTLCGKFLQNHLYNGQ